MAAVVYSNVKHVPNMKIENGRCGLFSYWQAQQPSSHLQDSKLVFYTQSTSMVISGQYLQDNL